MPEKKLSNVLWTNEALKNATSIKEYLKENFSEKEIQGFYSLLSSFEKAVSIFPQLYPQTNKKARVR
jgi:hypothetical protein